MDVPKDEGKATKAEQGLFADLLDDAAKAKGEVVGKAATIAGWRTFCARPMRHPQRTRRPRRRMCRPSSARLTWLRKVRQTTVI